MSNSTVGFGPSTRPDLENTKKVASLDPRLSRTDYFDGRLLTATDLIRDQTYVDERVLEVGRVLGAGVVKGLEVSLSEDKRYLKVNPGIAISESGRVLEVTTNKPLQIDLYDRALLINLNKGRYRRFNRGLYAVTLQYVEMGSDSAESYPADPVEKNEFQYDSFVEGAEVTLTPLNYPLPSDNELLSRSTLVQHFLPNPGQPREISDQAVSLGLLAINNDRPQWLDSYLLRRPMRPEHMTAAWQQDLYRHYLELLDTVMIQRNSQSQYGAFLASQYFHILPPAGVLPVVCADPVKAVQYFFPENYQVSISPVRYEDLAVIQSESMQLAPLDLNKTDAAEIMILAPMSNQDFMDNARSLGYIPESNDSVEENTNYWLHATDILQQRLSANASITSDNAATVWMKIWRTLGDGLLHYVRRPARAAETQVSAVVLAHGFEIPAPTSVDDTTDIPMDNQSERIAELEATIVLLTNENASLSSEKQALTIDLSKAKSDLNETEQALETCKRLREEEAGNGGFNDIETVLNMRGIQDPAIRNAAEKAWEQINNKDEDVQAARIIITQVSAVFDSMLWQSMEQASKKGTLSKFAEITEQTVNNPKELIETIVQEADNLGFEAEMIIQWQKLGDRLG